MSADKKSFPSRKGGVWILLATTILGFLYAVVIMAISPKKYESVGVVEVLAIGGREDVDQSIAAGVMTSGKNMEELAESLDLPEDWKMDMDNVITTLSDITEVEVLEDTGFLEIKVRHANPHTARDIAREIPRAYTALFRKDRDNQLSKRIAEIDQLTLRKRDLMEQGMREARKGVRLLGIENAAELEPGSMEALLDGLPKEVKDEEAGVIAKIRKDLLESEQAREAVRAFKDQRNQAEVEETFVPDPVKVHTEPQRAFSAEMKGYPGDLWWGAGKGLVFGLVLILVARFFLKSPVEEEGRVSSPARRNADPADVW